MRVSKLLSIAFTYFFLYILDMKDEKGLGNVTHPSSGIGGIGMVPFNKLFPNSIIIKEYQKTKIN